MPPPLHGHAVIGDGRSAALVAADATIDWLCWPRFDSEAALSAILGGEAAGSWRLSPSGEGWRSEQRYLPETNVLVTTFRRGGARVAITDLMPVASEEDKRRLLLPEHELLRIAECLEGEAELEMQLRLSPGFGARRPKLHSRGALGLSAETRQGAFFLRSDKGPSEWVAGVARAHFRLCAGERGRFSLTWGAEGPAVLAPLELADDALLRSARWWRQWVRRCQYDGPYREQVERSALALKLLCYPPSGAIVAAPTTSLPEARGGTLNWDYRFCWLRDAAFTARALFGLGLRDEGHAFVDWLLHATRLTHPRLRALYDVYGNAPCPEREVDLPGYEGARPVRAGNAAMKQLQLDLHGEVIDAVATLSEGDGELGKDTRKMLAGFGRFVCDRWRQPDFGVWELRGEPRQYTHSKVLCWAALDRLLQLHADHGLVGFDVERVRRERAELCARVRREGWNEEVGSYTMVLGGRQPDAALLLLPWYGFERASSPRVRGTLLRIIRKLYGGWGTFFRNDVLREMGDRPFVPAGFWAAEVLADGAAPLAEAERWFQRVLEAANPVGLYAEELDPEDGTAAGNFPQGYSHVGLISAALAIEDRRARQGRAPRSELRERALEEGWR